MRLSSFGILCFALLLPAAAMAQEAPQQTAPRNGANGLGDGRHSLSFSIPNGGNGFAGGAAGYWIMFGNLNVGFNVGLALDTGGDDTAYDILLAPTLRSYISSGGKVVPFWFGQVNLRLADNGAADTQELGVAGGIGVEWFPVPQFSVSGQVGLGVDIIRPDPLDPIALGTFTSALTAQMYFDGI
ncbi:MAG: hypothetical protein AAFQ82_23360 [Myxococcota bacterium]